MNKLCQRLAALAAVGLLASCGITGSRGNGDDNYFSAFITFPHQKWDYAAPAVLSVDTLHDSEARGGTLMLSVRHTDAYEYSNLWLELAYPDTDTTVRRDTINLVLADVYGRWRGHGSGPSMQIVDTLSTDFTIHQGDTLILRHIMRVDTLANIEQIGLVFYP